MSRSVEALQASAADGRPLIGLTQPDVGLVRRHPGAMLERMARGGRGFRQHWHDRSLVLDDGDVLRWLVIADPGDEPWVAYYRSDRRGGLHTSIGVELLRRHEHPDAQLAQRTDTPSAGFTHRPRG